MRPEKDVDRLLTDVGWVVRDVSGKNIWHNWRNLQVRICRKEEKWSNLKQNF
jgi:hypothetical protein